jgi:hypothetical protein
MQDANTNTISPQKSNARFTLKNFEPHIIITFKEAFIVYHHP